MGHNAGYATRSTIGAALGRLGLILALTLTTGLVPTSELDAADLSASPGDEFCRISADARTELRAALHMARSRPAPAPTPAAPIAMSHGHHPAPLPVATANEHRGLLSRRSRSPGRDAPWSR